MDLETRIAELDERLRQARADSSRSTVSSAPQRDYAAHDTFTSPLPMQPQVSPWSPSKKVHVDPKSRSPWRDVGEKTLKGGDDEVAKLLQHHRTRAHILDSRVEDTYGRLRSTNNAIASNDRELTQATRKREIADSDSTRVLDDAERRLMTIESDNKDLRRRTSDLGLERDLLMKQLEEVRNATRRADARLLELKGEENALHMRLKESLTAVQEHNKRNRDQAASFGSTKQRLEQRIAELMEDNKAYSERLRKIEAQSASEASEWATQQKKFEKDLLTAESQLHDAELRLETAEQELRDREAESEFQRRQREHVQAELLERRVAERQMEINRVSAEADERENIARREREDALAFLKQQLDDVCLQVERKRQLRDAHRENVQTMKRQATALEFSIREKNKVTDECCSIEEEVQSLEKELDGRRSEIDELQMRITAAADDLHHHRRQCKVLKDRLEEEAKLKQQIAEVTRELAEAELVHTEEIAALERQERDALDEQTALQSELDANTAEVERIHHDATVELDALSRKIARVRQQALDKEAELSMLQGENALKQTSIAQLEDERHKLEREQLQRKQSAAQAARAALSELA